MIYLVLQSTPTHVNEVVMNLQLRHRACLHGTPGHISIRVLCFFSNTENQRKQSKYKQEMKTRPRMWNKQNSIKTILNRKRFSRSDKDYKLNKYRYM